MNESEDTRNYLSKNLKLLLKEKRLHTISNYHFIKKFSIFIFLLLIGILLICQNSCVLKIIGIILTGLMYAHAIELQHQCLHYTAFKDRTINKIIGIIFGLPMLVSFTHYRVTHLYHHRNLGSPNDKEFFTYSTDKNSIIQTIKTVFLLTRYLIVFKNISLILSNRFTQSNANKKDLNAIRAEYLLIIVLVISFLTLCIIFKSWAIFEFWIIPILTVSEPIHFLIELPEHYGCEKNNQNIYKNTRTIKGSWFSSWFTNGNNFHVEHHLMPSVPNSKLFILHETIADKIIHLNTTYTAFYFSYFFKKNPFSCNKLCAFFIMWLLILAPATASAKNLSIKIAVLDNLMSQKLSSAQYVIDYMQGLDLAVSTANSKHISIKYKTFFYDRKPLSVLEQIDKIKEYNPDFIIGPRASDKFLLLKDYFKNILVISPLASSCDIKKMPSNFFTLAPTDDVTAKAIAYFVKYYIKTKNIFSLIETDCNSCVMISSHFQDEFFKLGFSAADIHQKKFVSSEVETANIHELIRGYHLGDVILMPDTSYSSGILISRITNVLKPSSSLPIFVGADGWGDWSVSYVGKTPTNYGYTAYRVSPELNVTPLEYAEFLKEYSKKLNFNLPKDKITFYIYHLITLVVDNARGTKKSSVTDMRKIILINFQKSMLHKNKKSSKVLYQIYQLNNQGEKKFSSITLNLNGGTV